MRCLCQPFGKPVCIQAPFRMLHCGLSAHGALARKLWEVGDLQQTSRPGYPGLGLATSDRVHALKHCELSHARGCASPYLTMLKLTALKHGSLRRGKEHREYHRYAATHSRPEGRPTRTKGQTQAQFYRNFLSKNSRSSRQATQVGSGCIPSSCIQR